MVQREVALHIGNSPLPVGALHVLDREKLVRHHIYGPLRQFEFAFKMIGMMNMSMHDKQRLVVLWDQLTSVALSNKNREQCKIDMDILIDQVFIDHINREAPPFLRFGRDIDNNELFGWFLDLDELEDVLLDDSKSSAFLISEDPNRPSFAHVLYHGKDLLLLRQVQSYDKTQGNLDLMDLGTGRYLWQVNEKITVDIHDYLDKTAVENPIDDTTLSVVELIRHHIIPQRDIDPWKN